ncbi:MAG: hypothetical protein P8Y71_05710 [Pseudolabrys sp.]|jgi:outer membrane biosynthesis protein TonB
MQFRTASAISTGLHAAVLLWAVVSFTGTPFKSTPAQSLPVDLVSEKEFSQMTKGVKHAPKPVKKPKPVVEKIDKPKPEDLKAKITKKQKVKATVPKPEEKAAPPKPDPTAKEIKKQKKKTQKVVHNEPLPPRRPPIPHKKRPKFNPDKIAALLNRRDPQRHSITGAALNREPTLGAAKATAAHLSQSELDALRDRLIALWNPPVAMRNGERMRITIRIRFRRDGTLEIGPQVITHGSGPRFNALRDSAVRAVFLGQPYSMLKPKHYDIWKEIDFTFDTSQMYDDIATH